MSTKKIVLIIVLIVLALLVGIVIWRYNVLSDLSEKYEQSTKSSNIYYHSESNNSIIDYWRKDNIVKTVLTQTSSNAQIIQWTNAETNENITVYPTNKTYSENNSMIMFSTLPTSQFVGKDAPIFLISILPTVFISSKEYNGQQCYCISSGGVKEYISKENGLMVYNESSSLDNAVRTYEFGIVTDEDIERPDTTGYTYQQ